MASDHFVGSLVTSVLDLVDSAYALESQGGCMIVCVLLSPVCNDPQNQL